MFFEKRMFVYLKLQRGWSITANCKVNKKEILDYFKGISFHKS